MRMYEFGRENEKGILLLHGAGCTYRMWTPQIKELRKTYHVYAPTISGHEKGDVDFLSSAEEAKKILTWFEENGHKKIVAICGVSLGAHVAAELLQRKNDFAEYAMIESIKAYRYKGLALKIFSHIGKLILKKCANTKGYMAGMYKKEYASRDSKNTIHIMSERSLDNIMIESGQYRIKDMPRAICAKTIILYGEKEKRECLLNTKILSKQIFNCKVVEIKGFRHGELAIGNPKRHLEYFNELVSKEPK
ncbi:MAG: alpha/beta hydrolase [bacterium]|nr:alpha/beta hydrolase [bacterium]